MHVPFNNAYAICEINFAYEYMHLHKHPQSTYCRIICSTVASISVNFVTVSKMGEWNLNLVAPGTFVMSIWKVIPGIYLPYIWQEWPVETLLRKFNDTDETSRLQKPQHSSNALPIRTASRACNFQLSDRGSPWKPRFFGLTATEGSYETAIILGFMRARTGRHRPETLAAQRPAKLCFYLREELPNSAGWR